MSDVYLFYSFVLVVCFYFFALLWFFILVFGFSSFDFSLFVLFFGFNLFFCNWLVFLTFTIKWLLWRLS
ncbi:hypothetical protein FEM41_00690 [Jejubacter calystegiae]|uniref:Uncharacterized protein n=1 Tax=Jejubacter calystegiae TaxID=2579935 RepID=A0A4P8YUB4_9ENTR|nr:hypothetical protein FEM41_00690 [Jejubacter calystegiae]